MKITQTQDIQKNFYVSVNTWQKPWLKHALDRDGMKISIYGDK